MSDPGHEWVVVIVSPVTRVEAARLLEGQRRTYRKLDTSDPETVRSSCVMCALCRLAPSEPSDMLIPCGGEV